MSLLNLIACKPNNTAPREVIAKVKGNTLTKEEFNQLTGRDFDQMEASLKDKYIDLWIKERLILDESQNRAKTSSNIDVLVKSYRNSLLIQDQKDFVVTKHVDTTVLKSEIDSVYADLSNDFEQRKKLVKCEVFVIPKSDQSHLDAKIFFNENKWVDFYHLMEENPQYQQVDSLNLVDWNKVKLLLPDNLLEGANIKKGLNLKGSFKDHYYFVKIYDVIDKDEIPPLEYMEEKLKSAILHKRIKNYLEEYENQLYQDALKKNQIERY